MKKIFKIGIVASLALFILGIGSVIAAVALGATWAQFTDATDTHAASLFSRIPHGLGSGHTGQVRYPDVESLDIDLGRGSLEILETDEDQVIVEVLSDPEGSIKSNMQDSMLMISSKPGTGRKEAELRLYLPEDTSYDTIHLDAGAASVVAGSLEADYLYVQLGTGTFSSTGEISADGSTWEVGVGELDLAYLDCEDTSLDCGMGCMTVTMANSREDYDCVVTCGMGAMTIGNDEVSMGSHTYKGDDADERISVECGMGTADLLFDGDQD